MRLDRLLLIQREIAKKLGGYSTTLNKVDGAANYVSEDAERIYIVGDNNTVYSKARSVTIIGNGVVIKSGVVNVYCIGTSNIIISESDVAYINGARIKDGVFTEADGNLIIDGGFNQLQDLFGTNIIEVVNGGLDMLREFNSQSNISLVDGGNNSK